MKENFTDRRAAFTVAVILWIAGVMASAAPIIEGYPSRKASKDLCCVEFWTTPGYAGNPVVSGEFRLRGGESCSLIAFVGRSGPAPDLFRSKWFRTAASETEMPEPILVLPPNPSEAPNLTTALVASNDMLPGGCLVPAGNSRIGPQAMPPPEIGNPVGVTATLPPLPCFDTTAQQSDNSPSFFTAAPDPCEPAIASNWIFATLKELHMNWQVINQLDIDDTPKNISSLPSPSRTADPAHFSLLTANFFLLMYIVLLGLAELAAPN